MTLLDSTSETVPTARMSASDVRARLLERWPPSEYVSINEAPQSSDRQGRKLDVLVVSLWKSRGYEIDGVEVKVSVSDWRRELKEAGKADWWWRHCHRFWIAAPADVAAKIAGEIPTGWGLLAVFPDKPTRSVVAAANHTPEPISWPVAIGLIRASADCGWNALQHAEQKGNKLGYERAKAETERSSGDEALRRKLADLTEKVKAFETAAGISIGDGYGTWMAEGLGRAVGVLVAHGKDPAALAKALNDQANRVEGTAASLRESAAALMAGAQGGRESDG